jgi:hypothetical protein
MKDIKLAAGGLHFLPRTIRRFVCFGHLQFSSLVSLAPEVVITKRVACFITSNCKEHRKRRLHLILSRLCLWRGSRALNVSIIFLHNHFVVIAISESFHLDLTPFIVQHRTANRYSRWMS